MKRSILLLLFIATLQFNSKADGYVGNDVLDLSAFDNAFGMFYQSNQDTLYYKNAKGKEVAKYCSTNLTVYNLRTGTSKRLFNNGNEKIVTVLFETGTWKPGEYRPGPFNYVIFNNEPDDYPYYVTNNIVPDNYVLSEKMIIVTWSYTTNKYTLWTCHKNGSGLIKVRSWSPETEFTIDVRDRLFLFVTHEGDKVDIDKVIY